MESAEHVFRPELNGLGGVGWKLYLGWETEQMNETSRLPGVLQELVLHRGAAGWRCGFLSAQIVPERLCDGYCHGQT